MADDPIASDLDGASDSLSKMAKVLDRLTASAKTFATTLKEGVSGTTGKGGFGQK